MPNPAARTILRNNPIFGGLPSDLLDEICALCANRQFKPGERIFLQGDPGAALYGVIAGRIRITVVSAEGQELHVNFIEPSEIIGEIAFLDGGVRTASATAVTATTCFLIWRDPFLALMDRRPELNRYLLKLLCERVRWTSRLVADSAFLNVKDRLAARLTDIALKGGRIEATSIRVEISQAELANHLGVSRQVVNGYLREWCNAGYVDISRGSITIRDLRALLSSGGR